MSAPPVSGEPAATLSTLISEAAHVAGRRIAEFGRLAAAVQQQRFSDRVSDTTQVTRSTALWALMRIDVDIAELFAGAGLGHDKLGKLLSISGLRGGPAAQETTLHPDFARAVRVYLADLTEQRPVELIDVAAAIVRDAAQTRGGLLPGRLTSLSVDSAALSAAIDLRLGALSLARRQAAPTGFSDDLAGDMSADFVRLDEDIPAGRDHLGMSTYVGMFASVIAGRKTPVPLSVGLFGEWGSGKSYFMGLLRARVKKLAESADPDYHHDIVQIGFNAWSYADSNLWASLGDEIFRQLAGADAAGDRKRPEALNRELQDTLERATELKAAREKAEREAARLDADLAQARHDYTRSLRAVVTATVQTGASSALGEAWPNLGISGETEKVDTLMNETQGIRTDAVAVRRALRLRWMALAGFAVVAAGFLLAGFWADDLRRLLSGAGATTLVAGVVFAAAAARRTRAALRTVGAEAARINARIEQNAEADFATEIAAVRQANARRKVIEAQLDEVLARAGEIGRELVDVNPGQRLYRFLSERAASGDYRSQLGLISTIRKDFQQLIKLMDEWREKPDDEARRPVDRIVLYIDDLDRCSPEQVVEVLQAVHLLLAFDLFVVVVGVDPRWLLHSLRQQYQRLLVTDSAIVDDDERLWTSTPGDYLEKIFNIPFVLPTMTTATFASLVDGLVAPDAGDQAGTHDPPPGDASGAAEPAPATPPLLHAEQGSVVASHDAPGEAGVVSRPRPLTDDELRIIHALAPLVGTPREAKRLLNIYRMLRSTRNLSEASRFLGGADEPGQYQAAAVLLGLLTAYPRRLGDMLRVLPADSDGDMAWADFLDGFEPQKTGDEWQNAVSAHLGEAEREEWEDLVRAARVSADLVDLPDLSAFRYWGDHVGRFSFVLSALDGRAA
jgi:hypothetical protein